MASKLTITAPYRLLFPLLICIGMLIPASATAAEDYRLDAIACNGASGQFDERGYTYMICAGQVSIMTPDGAVVQTIPTAGNDVAPSPDGSVVYVSNWNTNVTRWVRDANGAYAVDNAWKPQQFTYGGVLRDPSASHIATDGHGDLYIASGYWAGNLGVILKYRPDGSFVTLFGGYTNGNGAMDVNGDGITGDDPALWEQGRFYWNVAGIAVSRDGRYVYTTEVGNNRVQRFEFQPDGSYQSKLMWGNSATTDPRRQGSCANGLMAAPYDVALDPWGFVYVANTTCTQVQKFTADGVWLYSMWVGANGPAASGPGRAHYMVVDGQGNVWSTETNRKMTRTTPEPGPWPAIQPLTPDTAAPTVSDVKVPATTSSQTINLAITASDNVAVTDIRVANEDGTYGAWLAYTANLAHTLSANHGAKGVFVQVRDQADNRSTPVYKTLSYTAPAGEDPDLTAPVITTVTVPATTANRTITVTINATDNKGVTQMRLANEDGAWGAWTIWAAPISHTLTNDYGTKTLFVQVRDTAGNNSDPVYKTLSYKAPAGEGPDLTAPAITTVTVPATTANRTITVTIDATDNKGVTQMRLANEDGTWGAWTIWAAPISHTLTNGYGTKTLFVQVRDAAGNNSAVMSATTAFKAPVPPTPRITTFKAPTRTSTRWITVRLAVSGSRATQVRFANKNGTFGGWRTYSGKLTHRLTSGKGTKRVFVQVRNSAGVRSTTLNRRVTLR